MQGSAGLPPLLKLSWIGFVRFSNMDFRTAELLQVPDSVVQWIIEIAYCKEHA